MTSGAPPDRTEETAKVAGELHDVCKALTEPDRFRVIVVVLPVRARAAWGGRMLATDGVALVATDLNVPGATKELFAEMIASGGLDNL